MGKKEDNEIELFKLMEKYKSKGRVTSKFRTPEHNKKVGGVPTSFHQFQFGGGDVMDLKKEDKSKFVKEAKSKGLFAYINKTTGQVHADIGPNKLKPERVKAFKEFRDVEKGNALKGNLMFGSAETNPKVNDSGRSPQSVQDTVNKQDSAIQKEGNMAVNDLRPEKESDEERRKRRMIQAEQDVPKEDQRSFGEVMDTPTSTGDIVTDFKKLAEEDPTLAGIQKGKDSPLYNSLSTFQKDKAVEKAKNMDNLTKGGAQSEQDQGQGKQSNVQDDFSRAITFFLPSIVGGLVGHAIGGGEGAAQGVKLGMAGAKDYRQATLARDKFEATKLGKGKAGKIDITPDFVDKETNEPRFTKEINGVPKFIDDKGNVVSASSVKGMKSSDQALREERLTKQHDERMGFNLKKFDVEIQKNAQLSGKQASTLAGLKGVSKDIDEISRLHKDTVTGPIAGRLQSIGGIFGIGSSNFQELKSRTSSVLANYVKSISGAQSSDKEAVRLQSIIPSVNDSKLEFDSKLKQLKKIQAANIEGFSLSMSTGQPLKKETVKAMLKVLDAQEEEKEGKNGFSRSEIDNMKATLKARKK